MSASSPGLSRHDGAPDNRPPCRLEGVHVGVRRHRRSVRFAGVSCGEMLSRLLMGRMDPCCIQVLVTNSGIYGGSARVRDQRGRRGAFA